MAKRIVSFSPHKTALTVSIVFALSSLLFLIPMALAFSFIPTIDANGNEVSTAFPTFMFVAMPLGYLIFGYIGTAFMAWLYNLTSRKTGGIQFELSD